MALALTRKPGTSLVIEGGITIHFKGPVTTRIVVEAPRDTKILRGEIVERYGDPDKEDGQE